MKDWIEDLGHLLAIAGSAALVIAFLSLFIKPSSSEELVEPTEQEYADAELLLDQQLLPQGPRHRSCAAPAE